MPVLGEPWIGGDCEWPLGDRTVSAAVNPIYAHGASGFFHFRWTWELYTGGFHVTVWGWGWHGSDCLEEVDGMI